MHQLDSYKACIIGINQGMIGQADRRELTEEELYKKRQQLSKKVVENKEQKEEEEPFKFKL